MDIEKFGFKPHKISETVTREDLFFKDDFELRIINMSYLLCRRKTTNKKGNIEIMIRFYLPIPESEEVLEFLLTKGLK